MERNITCISCPMGCALTVTEDSSAPEGFRVSGNTCPRGIVYGIKEVTAPARTLTSTVKIRGGIHSRLPVVTAREIPKGKLLDAMKALNNIELMAPIKIGQVLVPDLADTGVPLVASRSMAKQQAH